MEKRQWALLGASGPLKCEEAKRTARPDRYRLHKKSGRRRRHQPQQTKHKLSAHRRPLLAAPAPPRAARPIRPRPARASLAASQAPPRARTVGRLVGTTRRGRARTRWSFLICLETRDVPQKLSNGWLKPVRRQETNPRGGVRGKDEGREVQGLLGRGRLLNSRSSQLTKTK